MAVRNNTKTSSTLRAMQRVWARNILKEHAAEHGTCNCQQCRDAKIELQN